MATRPVAIESVSSISGATEYECQGFLVPLNISVKSF